MHPESEAMHYTRKDRLPTHYKLFEEKVNNPWDKGDATGLVMYTDAMYWDNKLNDVDERMVDDWDLDFSKNELEENEKHEKKRNVELDRPDKPLMIKNQ
eukprot:UN03968